MARNPATEITIDNPQAKAAFVAWWATMMAQGYQYGYEALCNVWVGFDDGRSDLARKVLEVVEGERLEAQAMVERSANTAAYRLEECKARVAALNCALTALRELFAKEGIDSHVHDYRTVEGQSVPECECGAVRDYGDSQRSS